MEETTVRRVPGGGRASGERVLRGVGLAILAGAVALLAWGIARGPDAPLTAGRAAAAEPATVAGGLAAGEILEPGGFVATGVSVDTALFLFELDEVTAHARLGRLRARGGGDGGDACRPAAEPARAASAGAESAAGGGGIDLRPSPRLRGRPPDGAAGRGGPCPAAEAAALGPGGDDDGAGR